MCKVSHFSVTNQENPEKILLQSVINLPMEAHMNSMTLSSFGGLTLLRQEEEHLAIACQLASCITDRRRKYLVHHSLEEIIMTRIFQICLGYEDVNDCDDTNIDTYGKQEQTIFNTYYDSFCYMPLMVFEGYSGRRYPMHKELSHALRFYQRAA